MIVIRREMRGGILSGGRSYGYKQKKPFFSLMLAINIAMANGCVWAQNACRGSLFIEVHTVLIITTLMN